MSKPSTLSHEKRYIKQAQFDEQRIQQLIHSFFNKYHVVVLDETALMRSSELRQKLPLSFWDSLIVSGALLGGAEILYTEDLSDALVIENRLRVVNPFAPV